jgi:hypothetical protein
MGANGCDRVLARLLLRMIIREQYYTRDALTYL